MGRIDEIFKDIDKTMSRVRGDELGDPFEHADDVISNKDNIKLILITALISITITAIITYLACSLTDTSISVKDIIDIWSNSDRIEELEVELDKVKGEYSEYKSSKDKLLESRNRELSQSHVELSELKSIIDVYTANLEKNADTIEELKAELEEMKYRISMYEKDLYWEH